MAKYCAVAWCGSKRAPNMPSQYLFPKDPEICKKWLEFCQRDDYMEYLTLHGVEALRKKCYMICSDHFAKRCFRNPKNTSQGLIRGSVPTIMAGNPLLAAQYRKPSMEMEADDEEPIQRQEVDHSSKPAVTVEEALARLQSTGKPQIVTNATVFICRCAEAEIDRENFLKEQKRADDLKAEILATKEKIKKMRLSHRVLKRKSSRAIESVNLWKAKIRKRAEKCGLKADVSSDDNSDMSNSSD